MGSLYGTCEIVESKDELHSSEYSEGIYKVGPHEKRHNPLSKKQGNHKSLEDDINKLFESVHLKASFNVLSLSDETGVGPSRKNALKKPMRMSTSSSPGIGFSEPVSLKQALRGLCISQASEMAAMKRLAKTPGSPAISESGRLAKLRSSGSAEASGSGTSLDEDKMDKFEMTLVPEESTSDSSRKAVLKLRSSGSAEASGSGASPDEDKMDKFEITVMPEESTSDSSRKAVPKLRSSGSASASGSGASPDEDKMDKFEITVMPEESTSDSSRKAVPKLRSSGSASASGSGASPDEDKMDKFEITLLREESTSGSSRRAVPKPRRKGRLQSVPSSSGSTNNISLSKSTRSTPRVVKAVVRNKNLVKKKSKQDSVSAPGPSKVSNEVNVVVEPGTSQLICQRCQCHLKDAQAGSNKDPSAPLSTNKNAQTSVSSTNNGATGQFFTPAGADRSSPVTPVVVSHNKKSKGADKGEFTQSSKSSIGDYSTSTSISDESNLSVCSVGNRPHMSNDIRWQAVHHVMKQNGFLGLSHFNLLKKLGCGDIGTVYLAELIGTNCPFAIKVMDNDFLERRKKMPRAQTEREILRTLDHPFLPTLYAHFVSDNLSCLVMEYCPGGDLHVLRQKQPGRFFHEQAARFYVAEVLLALEYLHMLGVIYRDLKPENILVREDGHIMLTDFDLSLRCSVNPTLLQSPSLGVEPPRMSGPCAGSNCIDPFCIKPTCQVSCFTPRLLLAAKARKTKADMAAHIKSLPQLIAEPTEARSNSFVGTHEYLAPEIIKGDGHGSAVDWWTFGIFLYELLYGRTPFKGSGNEETLANVVLHSLKFPETPLVSLNARDLIKGLLVKEPENRLGSERGAAEIKQHPFFDGLNWALIRCAIPPELPEPYDVGLSKSASLEKAKKYLDCGGANGGQLEFELF